MSAVLILVAFAVTLILFAPRLMTRATWATRNPALGIWAWQTLSTSAATALVLAGVAAALPETVLGDRVAAALRACSAALANHYETPGGRPVAAVLLVASLGVLARFATVLTRDTRRARRHRRTQDDGLALVAVDHPGGFKVVDHGLPLVYCVPGRHQAVVVTSAAQRSLSRHQLDLVLAHERRHLVVRHHLALRVSGALSRTFLDVGVFGHAHREITLLAEMQADDAVERGTDRRDLARALLTLSPRTPAGSLA
ncbi:MAG: M56 family metallopeptidase, partial [Propionibacteriaceae bacterium]